MSLAKRILGHFGGLRGGLSRSAAKIEAARENLPARPPIVTSSPAGLLMSLLPNERPRLSALFKRTYRRAKPYPDVDEWPEETPMEYRTQMRGNTNSFAETRELQQYNALRAVRALDLPAEAKVAASLFLVDIIDRGMTSQPLDMELESLSIDDQREQASADRIDDLRVAAMNLVIHDIAPQPVPETPIRAEWVDPREYEVKA